jgi:hypothetical protein
MKLPQLSLRELFQVVLAFALAVGWWCDSANRARENRLLQLELNAAKDSETALRTIVARDQQFGSFWNGAWFPPPGSVKWDGFQLDAF